MRGAPVNLYLDGNKVTVHPIDAPAWRSQGWGEDPSTVSAPAEAVEEVPPTPDEDAPAPVAEEVAPEPAPAAKRAAKA